MIFTILLTFATSTLTWAHVEFKPLREDATMPANCVHLTAEDFSEPRKQVIYGITGAKAKGFTHELNILRDEARTLWRAVRGEEASIDECRRNEKLNRLLDILETDGRRMGFGFGNEGDILEAFALLDLQKRYPNETYFRTGGYEYSNGRGPTIGELDILVGRRSDCNIIVVGEAKLGHKMLGKARQQLARFENFYARENP